MTRTDAHPVTSTTRIDRAPIFYQPSAVWFESWVHWTDEKGFPQSRLVGGSIHQSRAADIATNAVEWVTS